MTRAEAHRAALGALAVLGACALAATSLRSSPARAKAPPGHFVDVGDGTVADTATGLVWQRVSPPDLTFGSIEAASAYCAEGTRLPGAGWRPPSAKELATLVDRSQKFGYVLDPIAFPGEPYDAGVNDGAFWTSTACLKGQGCVGPGAPVLVDFRTGRIGTLAPTARIRCVRSP